MDRFVVVDATKLMERKNKRERIIDGNNDTRTNEVIYMNYEPFILGGTATDYFRTGHYRRGA